MDSANATMKYGVAVKCATITPNAQRVEEYHLHRNVEEPQRHHPRHAGRHRVPRAHPGQAAFTRTVRTWEKPITIARHAYGDVYRNTEMRVPGPGKAELVFTDADGTETRVRPSYDFQGSAASCRACTIWTAPLPPSPAAAFSYALDAKQDLWFSTKDTISKTYDHRFKDIFARDLRPGVSRNVSTRRASTYFYTLIDDAVARVIRSQGRLHLGVQELRRRRDERYGRHGLRFSLAMMTSVLVSPDGNYEYEAAHGTVTRHYYQLPEGRGNLHQPAWRLSSRGAGALRKRGELDQLPDLMTFADRLEKATLGTINDGIMTKDLALLYEGEAHAVNSKEFLQAIQARM